MIDAYAALLEPAVPPGIYNVASGEPHTIRELLDALMARAGSEARIEVDPERVRPTDQLLGNADKLRRVTGWVVTRGFDRMIEDLADDWRERVRA